MRHSGWLLFSLALFAPCGAADEAMKPALLLAQSYHEGIDLSAYWVSEKFDGVRAFWNGTQLISRGGQPIHAPDWFTTDFPPLALDGELWIKRGKFEQLSGTVRQLQPDSTAWREVRFMVFDAPEIAAPFGERLRQLQQLFSMQSSGYLVLVEQFRVADHAELMTRLDAVVQAGGEGLMLHRADSAYRAGRSADLLKVKPNQDAEATVLAHLPGQGKYRGMLGALLVRDEHGRQFRLGTGLTDADRRNPPPIGSVVTFKFRGYTNKGTPRFASFWRIRPPE
ncbi:DNA ligase [Chromatium weissei]|nr:DNA ligase [Chromatium weissei]